jgi:hypothetical protein
MGKADPAQRAQQHDANLTPSSPSIGPPASSIIEVHPRRDVKTSAAFLKRFLAQFPAKAHTILTDNVLRREAGYPGRQQISVH